MKNNFSAAFATLEQQKNAITEDGGTAIMDPSFPHSGNNLDKRKKTSEKGITCSSISG